MATKNNKYMEWALKNQSNSGNKLTEKDKEMLKEMEEQQADVIDAMKRNADEWTDEKRNEFKKERSEREGIDYTIDLKRLTSAIEQGRPIVIMSVGTTGLYGSNEDTFFSSKLSNQATRLANGEIEFRNYDNIKNCTNDVLTQISCVYYEKGEDGFYHKSENKNLTLDIPLINVAPAILDKVQERINTAEERKRKVYDPFKEGGIDVKDLREKKGMQSDKVVASITEYFNQPEIKEASLMEFTGVVTDGNFKSFCSNFINHTFDALNIMAHLKEKVHFDRETDINLLAAINGYNLSGNRYFFPGKVAMQKLVDGLKEFKGEDSIPLMTSMQKTEGIAYLLNEVVLRDMLERESPETNLKIYEYCKLFDKAGQNIQQQSVENREKLSSLRDEIISEETAVLENDYINRSLGDSFPDIDDDAFVYPNEEMMEMEEPAYSEEIFKEDFNEDYEEPEAPDEEANEEDDKAYAEISAVDSVEDMVVGPQAVSVPEEKAISSNENENKTIAAVQSENTKQQDGNLYTDKEGGMNAPIVTADNVQKVGETVIPEIPVPEIQPVKEVKVTEPIQDNSLRELELLKKELELRSLEADLKLKEVELAKRELELQSKQPEMLRLAQNNNFVLMQTFCKTLGTYLGNDKQGQKVIVDALKEVTEMQKAYNEKMFELDEKRSAGR